MEIRNHEIREIYEKYAKALVKFGLRSGIELAISMELMQNSFTLLIVKHAQIKQKHNNLAGWVIKTNSNLIKRELSCPRRKHEVPLEDWLQAAYMDQYHFSLLDLIPKGLSSRQRTALVLFYEEDLSYKEIAAQMGISESYVGVTLTRARQELKKLYLTEEKKLLSPPEYN